MTDATPAGDSPSRRTVCVIDGCERPHLARGWCRPHYERWYQTGDVSPDVPIGEKRCWVPHLAQPTAEGHTFDPADERHGTENGYTNLLCRCSACKTAHADIFVSKRERRRQRLLADPSLTEHGRPSTYTNWACRCPDCTEAHARQRATDREAAKSHALAGTPQSGRGSLQ